MFEVLVLKLQTSYICGKGVLSKANSLVVLLSVEILLLAELCT
jgi:hypothetical protein